MLNKTNSSLKISSLFIIYYSLILIIVGTILNLLTFIVLCRTTFKKTNKRSTLHYMRVIALLDILILYGWNFDHYLEGTIGIKIETYSILSCKLFQFFNYLISQLSSWLRVFICFDRYLSLTRLYRTWFSRSKNVVIIITILSLIFIFINFHFLPFVCYYENNQININSHYYQVYPLWNRLNLILYNCLPFFLMIVFNIGVIYHLIVLKRLSTIKKTSRIQHRTISATLLITTCLFFLMTTPASITYAYFSYLDQNIFYGLDTIRYTYHILSFPIYFLTFAEFRREFFKLISFKNRNIPTIYYSEPSQTDKPNTNIIHRLFTISHTSFK